MPPFTCATLADRLLATRAALDARDGIALALRDHRRRLSLSQRAYAQTRGWSKARTARLEAHPGGLKLDDILDALSTTGYTLAVLPLTADATAPAQLPIAALLARDAAGRRLPAHVFVDRVTYPRMWWDQRHQIGDPWPLWSWWRHEADTSRARWDHIARVKGQEGEACR
jgi:hypothetical protein